MKRSPKELWIFSLFKLGKYPAENGSEGGGKSCKKIRVVNTQNYDIFSLSEKEIYAILWKEVKTEKWWRHFLSKSSKEKVYGGGKICLKLVGNLFKIR